VPKHCVKRIGIFGSYVHGTQKRGSDIDVVAQFEALMVGMRDKIIHFYFNVNFERVWLVVKPLASA
jgi:predicted nucleotidyltransferase